jgi:predicted transcriptional regulator
MLLVFDTDCPAVSTTSEASCLYIETITLLLQLKPALDQAKDIFRTKHRSKNLNMHLSVQTGELFWWPKQNEPNNKYTIMVNFQLAAVLLLFGDADEATEEMIRNSTRIYDRDVLALALQVLSTSIWVQQETKRKRTGAPIAPKQNAVDMILTKIVTGEGETSVTRYRVNENFSHDSENGQINLLHFFKSRAS